MTRAVQSGLFDAPPVRAAPKIDDPLCGFCQMPRSRHCPGNVEHVEEHRHRVYRVICRTRHCLAPLCCCVDFVNPQGAR